MYAEMTTKQRIHYFYLQSILISVAERVSSNLTNDIFQLERTACYEKSDIEEAAKVAANEQSDIKAADNVPDKVVLFIDHP